jgi:hypothetical protein
LSQDSSSMNVPWGNQRSPAHNTNNGATNVYMINFEAHL